jgi:hypothetical protein
MHRDDRAALELALELARRDSTHAASYGPTSIYRADCPCNITYDAIERQRDVARQVAVSN